MAMAEHSQPRPDLPEASGGADRQSALFPSFWMAGFECSTQRRRDGVRLDLLRATRHDRFAREDYRRCREFGFGSIRDGQRIRSPAIIETSHQARSSTHGRIDRFRTVKRLDSDYFSEE